MTAGAGQGGTVYVRIEPQSGIAGGTQFTLKAQAAAFDASAISPTSADANSNFTVEITGAQFTPITTVALVDGSTRYVPTRVYYQDSSSILALQQRECRELPGGRSQLERHVNGAGLVRRLAVQRRPQRARRRDRRQRGGPAPRGQGPCKGSS